MTFAQFFLGENINILLICTFISILFLGCWLILFEFVSNILFLIKILFLLFTFVWVRVTFPRYRYDQLMRLGWKIFLPLSLGWVILISSILMSFNFLI
jgi:NADH-quinone oxidoreductase subunit H